MRELRPGVRAGVAGAASRARRAASAASSAAACSPRASRMSTSRTSRRRTGRVGRILALEAEARAVLGQAQVAAAERDRREQPARRRVPLAAFEQALGLLEPALADAQVGEPDQRGRAVGAVAPLERPDRGEQLLLGFGPAADRDQDPAVVRPAGRRREVGPRDGAAGRGEPLLGAPDVGRALAGAEQPAVDLADRADAGHLPARDGGHRLVEQRHPLRDAAGGHVRLAQQRLGAELEVPVPEPPGDRERRQRQALALRRHRR